MKHWTPLTALESSLIRLSEFRNMFELLINGVENGCSQEVISSAVYTMSSMIDDIDEEAMSNFYTLWEDVKNDSHDINNTEFGNSWLNNSEDDTEFELNTPAETQEEEEAWKRLEEAIRSWKAVSTD